MFKKFLILIVLAAGTIYAQDRGFMKFLEGHKIQDIAEDKDNVWFASYGGGVFKYVKKTGKLENFSSANKTIQNDFIFTIEADENYVYAGSVDGLFMMDKKSGRWNKRKFGKGGQLSNWIRTIVYDPYSNLTWIGRFMYLSYFNPATRRFDDIDLTVEGNFKTNTIKTIAVDGDSLVWFGTEDGLHKYDKSRAISDEKSLLFYDNRLNFFNGQGENISVSDILFEQNNIWIALDEFVTEERPDFNAGGLYRYDRKNDWTRFDREDGFTGNGVFCIERTGKTIWVAMYQFDKTTKERYGRGVALLDTETGKVEVLFNEEIPQTVLSMCFDGRYMWLGTDNGLTRIDLYNEFANWE